MGSAVGVVLVDGRHGVGKGVGSLQGTSVVRGVDGTRSRRVGRRLDDQVRDQGHLTVRQG